MRARRERRPAEAARPASGFTLVELLVVLVILGAVAAIAVPLAIPSPPRGGDATLEDVRGALAAARREAVARGSQTSLHLELASGAYTLVAQRAGATADTFAAATIRLPPGVALAGGWGGWMRASFDPLGRARAERLLIISGGEHREVYLDPWTGGLAASPR